MKNCEETLHFKESSGRSLPKNDQLRGSGKIVRTGHCESYKDTEAAMIRPPKKGGREKVMKKVTEWRPDFGRARKRAKNRWEEKVLKKSTIGGRRYRIVSHRRESQGRQRRTRHWNSNEGKCEVTHHKLKVVELKLSGCYPTRCLATNNKIF